MDQRKDLQRLIKDAKENKFDCIVSYKNDRIARNTKEHNEFRTEMQRLGMPVVLSSTRENIYNRRNCSSDNKGCIDSN